MTPPPAGRDRPPTLLESLRRLVDQYGIEDVEKMVLLLRMEQSMRESIRESNRFPHTDDDLAKILRDAKPSDE